MEYSNIESRIKNIIFNTYDNVFNFDIKDAKNGGDTLEVIVTFRTSISQATPIRVKIVLEKQSGGYNIKRIYVTKAEKLQGLRESRIDEFVNRFLNREWTEDDINKFMTDNEDIIKDSGTELEKEDVISILNIAKEQKK